MPDDMTAPTQTDQHTADDQQQQQSAPKFAGRYETQEQFETGLRELAGQLEYPMPEEGTLIGQNGRFRDKAEAEQAYKAMQRLYQRTKSDDPNADGSDETPAPDQQQDQEDQTSTNDKTDPDNTMRIGADSADPNSDDLTVAQVLERAQLNEQELVQQWINAGQLTDDQYAKLKEQGYPRALVDTFLQGQQAQAEAHQTRLNQMRTEAQQLAGGDGALDNLFTWAAGNIDRGELGDPDNPQPGTLNARLADPNLYRGAILELKARYADATGSANSRPLTHGNNTGADASGAARISSEKEYFQVLRRAQAGDSQAKERLRAHIAATKTAG